MNRSWGSIPDRRLPTPLGGCTACSSAGSAGPGYSTERIHTESSSVKPCRRYNRRAASFVDLGLQEDRSCTCFLRCPQTLFDERRADARTGATGIHLVKQGLAPHRTRPTSPRSGRHTRRGVRHLGPPTRGPCSSAASSGTIATAHRHLIERLLLGDAVCRRETHDDVEICWRAAADVDHRHSVPQT
jgi:hypothetical protein